MGTNPMKADSRNQGLIGMADGIPLFRDKHSRSCIPVLLRTANMGDHLSMKFRYTHLTALVPCHFWIIGETSKQFERVERKPSHLCATLHAVVDDVLSWEDGHDVEDYSKEAGADDRWFQLCVRLLYWCGDYPGQGEASGFSHAASGKKACHWCEAVGCKCMGIDRMKYGDYYRCERARNYLLHTQNPMIFLCLRATSVLCPNILNSLCNPSYIVRILRNSLRIFLCIHITFVLCNNILNS
jgi:hypothetical protein